MEEESMSASELSADEDEVEPKFKYCRMTNHLQKIVSEDIITCISVASKFMCIGTLWGRIYLLDHQGNAVDIPTSFPNHKISVNTISIDDKGEYIASCSDDGIVHITGLYTDDSNLHVNLPNAVKCVELDPAYNKSGINRRFVIGDTRLTLYEKTFLKTLRNIVLSEAESNVAAIKWNNNFIAWASTGLGVRVYDLNEKCSLGLLKWEDPKEGKLADYRCNLRWCSSTTLLIGWVDTVRICVIRKRSSVEVTTRNVPGFIVDPISSFKTDFIVCGLAPMESIASNQLVVLGCAKKRDGEKAQRPVLCALEYKSNDYTEICIDTLSIKGYESYTYLDYHLGYLEEENQYFIVSPKDIVVASLYEADDRVQWLIEHGKFEEAMQVISQYGGKHTIISVARLYIDHLLSQHKYDEAAKLCRNTFGNDKTLWEEEVFKFVKAKQSRAVSPFLPRTNDCKLNPHVYEMVLYEYLQLDPKGFLTILKEWKPYLYNSAAVINAIHDHFDRKHQNILLEALAILYSHEKEYDKAVTMYLKLQHKDVFKLIRQYGLYSVIKNMILKLMQLDSEQAITLFLEKDKIPPEVVVEQLEPYPEYLHSFLDAFDKVDSSGRFHWKMVSLYATFSYEKLLPFLKRSNNYPIQQAFDICKEKLFYPEMVYLLGRMGNTKEALTIILQHLNDINVAIDFCKEHNDIDLWTYLIDASIDDPKKMTKLLDNIVGYVNPILLVNKIKRGKELPGLKSALIKMLSQYNLQVSVQEGCNKILVSDYFNLHERTVRLQQQAIYVNMDKPCRLCDRDILSKDFVRGAIIVFSCRHFVHENCMPEKCDEYDHCIVCKSEKNSTGTKK